MAGLYQVVVVYNLIAENEEVLLLTNGYIVRELTTIKHLEKMVDERCFDIHMAEYYWAIAMAFTIIWMI